MRVAAVGSRNWSDARLIEDALMLYAPSAVITGDCSRGADAIAKAVALAHGWGLEVFVADWKAHGRAAGPIRNASLLDDGRPDVVLIFSDDMHPGRGSFDVEQGCVLRGLPHIVYSHGGDPRVVTMDKIFTGESK